MAFIGPDGGTYEIASVQSDTALTLATPYGGADDTEGAYSIQPTQDYTRSLATVGAELITKYSEAVNLWERGEFSAGTEELPGVNFDGTANGLYMPEANTVGIVTDGVERLRVEADGTVEIAGAASIGQGLSVNNGLTVSGNTSLSGAVSVTGNASVTGNMTVGGNTALGPLTLNRSNNDSTSRGHVTITRGSGAGTVFTINSENTGANDVSALSILAGPLGSGVERLRLTSDGSVGLGVANPSAFGKFVAKVNTNQNVYIKTNGTVSELGSTNDAATTFNDLAFTGYTIRFNAMTGGSEVARFDQAGNFGLGTATVTLPPSNKGIHVHNATASQGAVLKLSNAGTGTTSVDGGALSLDAAGVMYLWNYENGPIAFATNNTGRLRLAAGGDVQVLGGNFTLTGTAPMLASADSGSALRIGTNGGVERLRVTSSGTVQINTTGSEQGKLQVNGDVVLGSGAGERSNKLWLYQINNTTNGAFIQASTGGSIEFQAGTTAIQKYMEITPIGDIGIFATPTNYTGSGYRTFAINNTTGAILEFQAAGVQQARVTGWSNTLGVHTNNIERLRINDSGVVTQGITPLGVMINPVFATGTNGMQVHNPTASNTTVMRLTNAGTGSAANNGVALELTSSSFAYLWNYSNGSLVIGTNNVEAMRIDTSQRLCIGKTSSLGYKVDVQGQIGVEDGTIRSGWGAGMFTAGTMGFGTTSNHRLTLGTNAIARMAISGSGTVSIGRLEPASGGTLEVSGNFVCQPAAAAPTLGSNGDMSFQRVSDTQLKVLMRGSDGTTRSVTLTLA
jgi:hypothetical protein